MTNKVEENRIRRVVERRALRLVKTRRRDRKAYDYGTYRIVEPEQNRQIVGGLKLEQIVPWLDNRVSAPATAELMVTERDDLINLRERAYSIAREILEEIYIGSASREAINSATEVMEAVGRLDCIKDSNTRPCPEHDEIETPEGRAMLVQEIGPLWPDVEALRGSL